MRGFGDRELVVGWARGAIPTRIKDDLGDAVEGGGVSEEVNYPNHGTRGRDGKGDAHLKESEVLFICLKETNHFQTGIIFLQERFGSGNWIQEHESVHQARRSEQAQNFLHLLNWMRTSEEKQTAMFIELIIEKEKILQDN